MAREHGKEWEDLQRESELYENPLTEKQRDILHAAERLFAEAGFAQTSTAAIAREAGVTERTLFKHFPSKHDLLKRVLFPLLLKTVLPMQLKHVKKILQSEHQTARELIRTLARDRWSAARVVGPRLRFLIAELMQNEAVRELQFKIFRQYVWQEMVQAVAHFQDKGELRCDLSAETLAQLILMNVIGHGILRGVIQVKKEFDDEQDLEILLDLLFRGIEPRRV